MSTSVPADIDAYIATVPKDVQPILRRIRSTIRKAAPSASEAISYRIPAFVLDGALVYFAAFKHHIGFYPPVRGDAALEKAVAPYANEKGNLSFPLDEPIPYPLIARIVRHRVKQNRAKAGPGKKKPARSRKAAPVKTSSKSRTMAKKAYRGP